MDRWKMLMVFATLLYVTAFSTPWICENYSFIIMLHDALPEIYPPPPVPREGWFWSFLAIIRTTRNENTILSFWDYWFSVNSRHCHAELFGWLGVFIFQVLTILVALITIILKREDNQLGIATTAVLSVIAPILCIYQQVIQSTYCVYTSQFHIGFWLAIASSILFFVSLGLQRTRNKPLTYG